MKEVRAQFGKTAAAYVSSATHAWGEDLERLIAVAAPQSGERARDLGCGVGHTLRRIAPLVTFAVGADATLEMMQAGRAFGFKERLRIGDHRAELVCGDGAVILTSREPRERAAVLVRVDDADRHHEQARKSGARIWGGTLR